MRALTSAQWDALRAVARARCERAEPAHDWLHVQRVMANVRRLAAGEGIDGGVAEAAALLHELFNYPKHHPDSSRSGDVCAEHAAAELTAVGADPELIAAVGYAVRVHGFSKGIRPETLEARILQDADRLDAIGAIGTARLFATCSVMQRPFYEEGDPFCLDRAPDDKAWGMDHYFKKLFRIPETLHTATARALAGERIAFMHAFLRQFGEEMGTPYRTTC